MVQSPINKLFDAIVEDLRKDWLETPREVSRELVPLPDLAQLDKLTLSVISLTETWDRAGRNGPPRRHPEIGIAVQQKLLDETQARRLVDVADAIALRYFGVAQMDDQPAAVLAVGVCQGVRKQPLYDIETARQFNAHTSAVVLTYKVRE